MTNVTDLLKPVKGCACGMDHVCPISALAIGEGALEKLPEMVKDYRRILLAADDNTYRVAGDRVTALLKDQIAATHVYHAEGFLVPNEEAIDALAACVTEDTDLIVGIGAGVINDLCKYVSFQASLPYGRVKR